VFSESYIHSWNTLVVKCLDLCPKTAILKTISMFIFLENWFSEHFLRNKIQVNSYNACHYFDGFDDDDEKKGFAAMRCVVNRQFHEFHETSTLSCRFPIPSHVFTLRSFVYCAVIVRQEQFWHVHSQPTSDMQCGRTLHKDHSRMTRFALGRFGLWCNKCVQQISLKLWSDPAKHIHWFTVDLYCREALCGNTSQSKRDRIRC
jgi:hypothetical protein